MRKSIMEKNSHNNLTEKNLDKLAELLTSELKQPNVASHIPNGSHIFHGSYNDKSLTQYNLQLVSKTLLGMTLGYIEDAPLVLVFEYKPGKQTVINLSDKIYKSKAQRLIEGFQEQNRHEMTQKINELKNKRATNAKC